MGMAAQVYNLSTKEVEAGDFYKLEDSLDYLEALPKKNKYQGDGSAVTSVYSVPKGPEFGF